MDGTAVRLKVIGITDNIIEKVHNIESEMPLREVLREALKGQSDIVDKIAQRLVDGRLLLIVNGLSVYRFRDPSSIIVKPGDEVAIMPVVFGGCKQL